MFDVYSPTTSAVKDVHKEISKKVNTDQAHRVVVSLRDTSVSPRELREYLKENEISKLKEIILIDQNGMIKNFLPFKN